MGSAWFVLGFLQLGSGRWFARYWKYSHYIHAISGSIITGITLFEGISATIRITEIE